MEAVSFLSVTVFRQALGPIQSSIKMGTKGSFPGEVIRSLREFNPSFPPGVEIDERVQS